MSDIAISVQNLSKQYKLGATIGHDRLKDLLTSSLNGLFRRSRSPVASPSSSRSPVPGPPSSDPANRKSAIPNSKSDFIWALKDVSFEVKQGETLGIIGANGAGKSTLLKILSRITEPTFGRAEIYGRIGSLLEVGTGFDRELTGRENIYLNGAVLGMAKREINRKFDEIVDFSGVEKFIDTPVKRYSSGMYVRLAFAVAAHLEPEILIVDEVLAVGDAAFQKKCLGKMGDVAKLGRTVLFVTHNMGTVLNLCERGLLLSQGKAILDGSMEHVVTEYHSLSRTECSTPLRNRLDREGDGALRLTSFYALCPSREVTHTVCTGGCVTFIAEYEAIESRPLSNVSVAMTFYNPMGQHLLRCSTRLTNQNYDRIEPRGKFRAHIPKFPLLPGRYSVNLHCEVNGILADWVQRAAVVDVVEGDFFGTGDVISDSRGGVVTEHHWDCLTLCEKAV